jgi:hypothetical protein
MQRDDLPLFQWQPPVKVIVFPLKRRLGKIRHTANLLLGKRGDDADLYWKQVIAANRKHLERVGLDENEIGAELQAFFDAVQGELVRLTYAGKNSGGAA